MKSDATRLGVRKRDVPELGGALVLVELYIFGSSCKGCLGDPYMAG